MTIINLHIDRVALDGVSLAPPQRAALKASLECELGRLLGQQGIAAGLQNGASLKALQAAPIAISEVNEPSHLGQQIAQSVYGGIGK